MIPMTMLDAVDPMTPTLDGEPIRPLKAVEYRWLKEQGFLRGEALELLFGVMMPRAPNYGAAAPGDELVPRLDGAQIRPLKRIEYEALARAGFLENDDIELLFGVMVPMSPTDGHHRISVSRLVEVLILALHKRAHVYCQMPFAANQKSEPEPDVYITERVDGWTHEHPAHAIIAIEVARSSLRKDRKIKGEMYAYADVDEYWIVNHIDGCVEVYRDRQPNGTWRTMTVHLRGETIAPLAFPDVLIAVDDIVPPPEAS